MIAGGKLGEIYVIGGENEKRNIDIVKAICSAVDETLGRSPGTSAKLIKSVTDRLGHDRRYAIDPAKIRTELGWKPKKTFENTLMDVVRWYLDSATWAKEIHSGEYMKSSR